MLVAAVLDDVAGRHATPLGGADLARPFGHSQVAALVVSPGNPEQVVGAAINGDSAQT